MSGAGAKRKPAGGTQPAEAPFWKCKSLEDMTKAEWESLCDGCARCCLVKLEDEDDGAIHFTDIGCTLLDCASCRCSDYPNRSKKVADCVRLTPEAVRRLKWLPVTCAYRLVAEGKDLAWWHPLVSGDPETVHRAGVSVRGKVSASEDDMPLSHYPDRIRVWPNRWPAGAKRPSSRPKRSEEPGSGSGRD